MTVNVQWDDLDNDHQTPFVLCADPYCQLDGKRVFHG